MNGTCDAMILARLLCMVNVESCSQCFSDNALGWVVRGKCGQYDDCPAVGALARTYRDGSVRVPLLDKLAVHREYLNAIVLTVGHDQLIAVWVDADIMRQIEFPAHAAQLQRAALPCGTERGKGEGKEELHTQGQCLEKHQRSMILLVFGNYAPHHEKDIKHL